MKFHKHIFIIYACCALLPTPGVSQEHFSTHRQLKRSDVSAEVIRIKNGTREVCSHVTVSGPAPCQAMQPCLCFIALLWATMALLGGHKHPCVCPQTPMHRLTIKKILTKIVFLSCRKNYMWNNCMCPDWFHWKQRNYIRLRSMYINESWPWDWQVSFQFFLKLMAKL